MAQARRRSTRGKKSEVIEETTVSPSNSVHEPQVKEEHKGKSEAATEETCPSCPKDVDANLDKNNWIRCDACKVWYHWGCAGNGEDSASIDKWYCTPCLQADPKRAITQKAPARKSDRKRAPRDYAGLNSSGMEMDPTRWVRMMDGKHIKSDQFKRMKGADVGLEWLQDDETAMSEPIIIEKPDGLGMKMPPSDFTVEDVVEDVGDDVPVEVTDVASQSTSPGWNLGKWADYWALEPGKRDKVRNVISLEVSGTPLADRILPPRLVRELDWVDNFWPSTRKGKGHTYPKVQLYCLMGVAQAWTDWHIDFAGSSVYYHILSGSKVFYFIRPTPANLAAYEKWSGTEIQNQTWLGDMVDEVVKVSLTAGNTMIIPTGWIHAVHTPEDTLVFGGNFLHSYDVATQLKVRDIEIATSVPRKFRFPMFSKLCWYVGDKYLRDLRASPGSSLPPRVATSVAYLADFLVSQVRILEGGDDAAKKEVKEQIPHDRVKDPAVVARELRWRVRIASGLTSDDEDGGKVSNIRTRNGAGTKRKRTMSEDPAEGHPGPVRFKNFKPRKWDSIDEKTEDGENREVKCRRPLEDEPVEKWTEAEGEDMAAAMRRRQVLIKVRRTRDGLEREVIERTIEEWKFQ
ncbi:Clavaminate synthase-like protein [Armillaria solidipes]|uniref:JmjC domain-containing histone demethylation protein 1 n=1 Tax=Armillaria solidipes TaxID=1076256 RepID=A0A2H3CR96_9AGAR|nr:Clavaminate synthase-like protein [Armillaria solidipes]